MSDLKYVVEAHYIGPFGNRYSRTLSNSTTEDAVKSMERCIEDPNSRYVEIWTYYGSKRLTLLKSWTRLSADTGRTAEQSSLDAVMDRCGTTLPAGGNAGI